MTGKEQILLQELVAIFIKVTDEVIREKIENLVNSNIKQGNDPDSNLIEKTLARSELQNMDETISDRRAKDMCSRISGAIQACQNDDVPIPDFRRHSDSKHDAPSLLDDLSGKSDTKITGRGVAMTAASTCSH